MVDTDALAEGVSDNPIARVTEQFVTYVELVAAAVFALLFGIGVVDLMLQIGDAVLTGSITDPLVVIGFIDTGLLLLIIVEVYRRSRASASGSYGNQRFP